MYMLTICYGNKKGTHSSRISDPVCDRIQGQLSVIQLRPLELVSPLGEAMPCIIFGMP